MHIHFRKYQALGNDYIVVDPCEFPFIPLPDAVRAICDRNKGVGSDGILLGPLADGAGFSCFPGAKPLAQGAVPWLRIFNPDGSEAEKSGNGLRIFSLFLVEQGYEGSGEFSVATKGGKVSAQVESLGPPLIRVDMGEPSFSARDAGLRTDKPEFIQEELVLSGERFRATFVSMGNPHCVLFVDEPGPALARRLGPLVEHHPLFPERTNVQFARVVDRHTIRIEIWERGAGYTLASGSSSCAAASAAKKLGLVEGRVKVLMPGGALDLDLSSPSVQMTGPALRVFDGCFSDTMMEELVQHGASGSRTGANEARERVK